MKKVVAEFVYSLNDGGAETLIKNYCKTIDRKVFDLIIIVMYDIGETAVKKSIQEMGIPIIFVYTRRTIVYRGINFLVGRIYVRNRLKNIIEQYNISTIHAHTAVLRYLYYSRYILNHIRLLYTCHSTPERYFSGRLQKEDAAARYLIKHNELQMIALHDSMAQEINEWFNIDNTIVIRNGLILSEYNLSNLKKEEIRNKLGIKKEAFVIGHVGRFIDEKNHWLIVKVFKKIKEDNPSAVLLLVGDGELEEDIRNYLEEVGINNDCVLLSHRNDVPQLIAAMDVFLFPSKVEGLGIALVEAQVIGLPCVVSEMIPQEAIISNNVSVLKLEDSLMMWASEVENKSTETNKCNETRLSMYDLEAQMRILEKYYV